MQLPGYKINNALLDFAPLNQGIDSYRQGQEASRRAEVARTAGNALMSGDYKGAMGTALAGDRADLAGVAIQARAADSHEQDAALKRQYMQIDRMGRIAAAAADDPNPDNRQKAHAWLISQHPGKDKLDPMYLDPNTGLKMLAAEAGQYKSELEKKMDAAKLGLVQAQIHQAYRKDEPDVVRTLRAAGIDPQSEHGRQLIMNSVKGGSPMDQMIAEAMRGAMKPQQAPQQQQGGIIPQSFDGGEGGIVPVQTGPRAMPQQAPSAPTVQTPFGPMPKSQADIIGFGLAMQGKGDAGKMMTGQDDKLGKEAGNKNDTAALNSIEQASRLDGIAAKFKPEYQTYDFAAKNWMNSKMDSVGATRGMVPPEQRQKMAEYTQFRQDSLNNLSAYIKEITGAAMGVQEEKRIRGGMPDPEKDSPIEFESKMKNSIATAKLALARHAYLKRNGYDDGSIATMAKSDKLGTVHSLDDMKSIINRRLDAAAQDIKRQNPNIDDMSLRNAIRQVQRREFGI